MSIEERLKEALRTAESRGRVYGAEGREGYRLTGKAMSALFPDGLKLETEEDFTRFLLFSMVMTKIGRYAINLHQGGHPDSIHDNGVYSFILEDYDDSCNRK